jgi:hypothetical protein
MFAFAIACLAIALIGCEGKGGGGASNNPVGVNPPVPPIVLPPDPGDEGKETLEGTDSNGNGVRDDVEIAISEFAPLPEQEGQRKALTQAAKAFQASVLAGKNANDTEAALAVQETLSKALQCLRQSGGDSSSATTLLEITIANTDERLFAYWRYNEALSGRVFESVEYPEPCE